MFNLKQIKMAQKIVSTNGKRLIFHVTKEESLAMKTVKIGKRPRIKKV